MTGLFETSPRLNRELGKILCWNVAADLLPFNGKNRRSSLNAEFMTQINLLLNGIIAGFGFWYGLTKFGLSHGGFGIAATPDIFHRLYASFTSGPCQVAHLNSQIVQLTDLAVKFTAVTAVHVGEDVEQAFGFALGLEVDAFTERYA